MSQMLASDLNNPQFTGAQNPDSLLHVEFYWNEPIDKWETETKAAETGRYVPIRGPKQPFIRIMRPGDNTSIIETRVREEHKQRWPERWLYWQMQEGLIEGGGEIPGWKIEEWTHLNPEQCRDLKFMRFQTVEQIAGCSDAQVQKIGMGGAGLREMARQALRAKMGAETKSALDEKDKQIADLTSSVATMQKQVEQLLALATAPKDTLTLKKKD